MASNGLVPWRALEARSPLAFLVAGTLLLGFVAINGLEAFTSVSPPRWSAVVFVAPGLLAGHLGLFGLYPRVSERVPRHALVSSLVVGIATIGVVGLFVTGIGAAVLGVAPDATSPIRLAEGLSYLVSLVATILGYISFGVAALRVGDDTRKLGSALLGPPAVFLVMTAGLVTGVDPEWSTVLLSALQAGAHLAIWVVLRSGTGSADPTGRAVESTAR